MIEDHDLAIDVGVWGTAPGTQPLVHEIQRELEALGGRVHVERAGAGVRPGREWALPTAFVIFLGARYLRGFFEQGGEDHSTLLRSVLGRIRRHAVQRAAAGRARGDRKPGDARPGALSIYYVVERGRVLKFVFGPLGEDAAEDPSIGPLVDALRQLSRMPGQTRRDLAARLDWRVVFRFDEALDRWRMWSTVDDRYLDDDLPEG